MVSSALHLTSVVFFFNFGTGFKKSKTTDHQSRLDALDKCSGLVHVDDPEGWDGEGGGRGIQDGEHM